MDTAKFRIVASIRKETFRGVLALGAFSISAVEYERVTISEAEFANQPFDSIDNKITVRYEVDEKLGSLREEPPARLSLTRGRRI